MERSDVISATYRTAPVPVERDYAAVAADPLIVLHAAVPFDLQGPEPLFSEVHLTTTTRKIPSFSSSISRVRSLQNVQMNGIGRHKPGHLRFRLTALG